MENKQQEFQFTEEQKEEVDKMKENMKKALEEFMTERKGSSKKQILKGNYRKDREV